MKDTTAFLIYIAVGGLTACYFLLRSDKWSFSVRTALAIMTLVSMLLGSIVALHRSFD